MSYRPELAAALSGASLRQLSYWRSLRTPEPLLRPEVHEPRSRVRYSFQDVLALRTFVYLLTRGIPLRRVRRAVRSLRDMGETKHLSSYRLVASGREVTWQQSDDDAVDLTRHPGHRVIAEMADIIRPFSNERNEQIVDLLAPKAGVEVDPNIRGGYPVIQGTRVPYDIVASLCSDGLTPEQISAIYPSVDAAAVPGAAEFAKYVEEHRGIAKAA
jgi:uncharacterized protein (DUF433 family)